MTKAFKSGLAVFISIFVILIVIAAVQFIPKSDGGSTSAAVSSSTNRSTANKVNTKEYIAALYVEGTIAVSNNTYNQHWLLSTIDTLKNDSRNLGIALFVNSPGGAVYQADEVYLALQDYKTAGKKIWVYQGPMAASGGYYISCAGNQIYANRNTLTGSIGVISGQFVDVTEFLENLGIYTETIHSGSNKLLGSSTEPLTDEQRDIMQSISDECYQQFVSIIANQRHMSYDKAEALADGRIYTASQALDNGLIDGIDSWSNMLDTMMLREFDRELKVINYKYEPQLGFMNRMLSTLSKLQKQEAAAKLGLPVSVLEQINDENFNSYPAYLYR